MYSYLPKVADVTAPWPPRNKASMTVEGKMFGLTFHEQWYVLGKGDGYRVVAYKGDTQQGPYEVNITPSIRQPPNPNPDPPHSHRLLTLALTLT